MFPKYKEIEIPLLIEIIRRGGSSKPSDVDEQGRTIYNVLADYFDLSQETRNVKVRDSSRLKWNNMVQWAKNELCKQGFIYRPSERSRGIWEITPLGREFASEFESEEMAQGVLRKGKKIDPQEFQKQQTKFAEICEQGEKFVLNYERKFLIKNKLKSLADRVKWIAKEDIAAGYDILSFDLQGQEKYIEVKTSKSNILRFYLTENELNIAKQYGSAYWIYKVVDTESKPKIILKIKNPAEKVLQNQLILQPMSYRVTVGEDLE